MDDNKFKSGVSEYLNDMLVNGRNGRTFPALELQYGIEPYDIVGQRARKLWKYYQRSGKSVGEYIAQLRRRVDPRSHTTGSVETSRSGASINSLPLDLNIVTPANGQREFNVSDTEAMFKGKTTKSIQSLEDALEFSKVDLNVWRVESHGFNSWDVTMKIEEVRNIDGIDTKVLVPTTITNYGCWIKFKPIEKNPEVEYQKLIDDILISIESFRANPVNRNPTRGVGVLNLADFHIGADVSDLILTPDFNTDILVGYLDRIATVINSYGYSQVHVNMLGDYFESISGLNHLNTFKSLGKGMYGAKVIILAATMIGDFLNKINNLAEVNVISGNHDRLTPQADIDNEGGAAELLSHILSLKMQSIKFNYHTYCLRPVIDGICYLLTHGHFKMDKKDTGKLVNLFGSTNVFTLWLSGHIHSRHTHKTKVNRPLMFNTYVAVSDDEANYRKIVLPALFTGNFYSETLGYTSTGGFVITENNGNGKPNVYDHSI